MTAGGAARIGGISEAALADDAVRRSLRAALAEHGLVILEDVEPSDRLQALVGRVFGRLKDYGSGDVAEMVADPHDSTIVEIDGATLAGWMPWHFDQCYDAAPNVARVLRCGRGVASGGTTGFLDGVALYRALDPALRAAIAPCRIRYALVMAYRDWRFGVPADFRVLRQAAGTDDPRRQATHPAVRTLPDGRAALHVSPWMATRIVDRPDGDPLLDDVAHEIARLGRTIGYHHAWRPGDIVIWDNRRLLHCAGGHDPAETRIMHRCTVQG